MITTVKVTTTNTVVKCDRCGRHNRVTKTLKELFNDLVNERKWHLEELPDGQVRALCRLCHDTIIEEWYQREKPFMLTDDCGSSPIDVDSAPVGEGDIDLGDDDPLTADDIPF